MTVDRPEAEVLGGQAGVTVTGLTGKQGIDVSLGLSRYGATYAGSAAAVDNPRVVFYHRESLLEPSLKISVKSPERFPVKVETFAELSQQVPRMIGSRDLTTVYGGQGTPEEMAAVRADGRVVLLELPPEAEKDPAICRDRARNVAAVGGVAVLHINSQLFPYCTDAPIPVAYTFEPAGLRLPELAKAGGLTITWRELSASPFRYEAFFGATGRVPVQQSHVLHDRDLAAVETTYRTDGIDTVGGTGSIARVGELTFGGALSVVPWPSRRTDYFTPGDWQHQNYNYELGFDGLSSSVATFRAGHSYELDWTRATIGPGLPPASPGLGGWAYRDHDRMELLLPMLSDASGNLRTAHALDLPGFKMSGTTDLYRDGVLVGHAEGSAAVFTDLPRRAPPIGSPRGSTGLRRIGPRPPRSGRTGPSRLVRRTRRRRCRC